MASSAYERLEAAVASFVVSGTDDESGETLGRRKEGHYYFGGGGVVGDGVVTELGEDEEEGLVRFVAGSSGDERWEVDRAAEEAEFSAAAVLLEKEGVEAWLEANRKACEKWRLASLRLAAARKGAGQPHTDAEVDAEAYRLEAATWALMARLRREGLLAPPGGEQDDERVRLAGEQDERVRPKKTTTVARATEADAARYEVVSSDPSKRRTATVRWLEDCAAERVVASCEIPSLENACEKLARAALEVESIKELADSEWPRAEILARAADSELAVSRAAWTACRAGRWTLAADMDDRAGVHWRAAACRARERPGYDDQGLNTGNSKRELWRTCCSSMARAALENSRALREQGKRLIDAFGQAAAEAGGSRIKTASSIESAVVLAERAADFDACRFAALAADLATLRLAVSNIAKHSSSSRGGGSFLVEDSAWAYLTCLEDAAASQAAFDLRIKAHSLNVPLAPYSGVAEEKNQDRSEVLALLATSGIGGVLDLVLLRAPESKDTEDDSSFLEGNATKTLRVTQARLAASGLEACADLLGADDDDDVGSSRQRAVLGVEKNKTNRGMRMAAHLALAWKRLVILGDDVDDTVRIHYIRAADRAIRAYALNLGLDRGLYPLACCYAAGLFDVDDRLAACALSVARASTVADKRACVRAIEASFPDPAHRAEIARRSSAIAAKNALEKSNRDAAVRALDWLSFADPTLAPGNTPDAVQLLRRASLVIRAWVADDLSGESADYFENDDDDAETRDSSTSWHPPAKRQRPNMRNLLEAPHAATRSATSRLARSVPPSALDRALDACRGPTPDGPAFALKEYLAWRLWFRALDRVEAWRAALDRFVRRTCGPESRRRSTTTFGGKKSPRKQPRLSADEIPQGKRLRAEDDTDAATALMEAAARAKLALELVAAFPGEARLARVEWGAAVPHFDDFDDDEDVAWRLDALCVAVHKRTNLPVAGFLNPSGSPFSDLAHEDSAAEDASFLAGLRADLVPPVLNTLVDVAKHTADALKKLLPDHANEWYVAGIAVADLVARPRHALLDPAVLSQDDAAKLLDKVGACALELIRDTPEAAIVRVQPKRPDGVPPDHHLDLDWAALLALHSSSSSGAPSDSAGGGGAQVASSQP